MVFWAFESTANEGWTTPLPGPRLQGKCESLRFFTATNVKAESAEGQGPLWLFSILLSGCRMSAARPNWRRIRGTWLTLIARIAALHCPIINMPEPRANVRTSLGLEACGLSWPTAVSDTVGTSAKAWSTLKLGTDGRFQVSLHQRWH